MLTLLDIYVFILGTIVGSFLNVVILRFNTGKNITGRSGCFSCGKNLSWFELIPVASFLAQRGKCRGCKAKVSLQYPAVELLTGFVFFVFGQFHSLSLGMHWLPIVLLAIDLVIVSVLIVIGAYDLRHKIIPDILSALFIALALCKGIFLLAIGAVPSTYALLHLSAAFILSGFFFALWLVSKGAWIGLGDAKLAFGMGLFLGVAQGLSAFAFAFWIGATFALIRMGIQNFLQKNNSEKKGTMITMKSEIPFAPFLLIGTFLAYTFQSDVFHSNLFF